MSPHVIGIFNTPELAEHVMHELLRKGFEQEQMGLLMNEQVGGERFVLRSTSKASETGGAGALAGGVLGAVAAGLAAVTSIAIPGLGLVAAGPLLAALAGAGAGAATGGLVGALVGLGMNRQEAEMLDQGVRGGDVMVGVHVRDKAQRATAEALFKQCGALNWQ